jgi:hypothetical protein
MGYDPCAVCYAAAWLDDLFGSRVDTETKTKYNPDTGEPYEAVFKTEMTTWPGGEMPKEEFEECDVDRLLPKGISAFDTNYEGEGPQLAGIKLADIGQYSGEWLECDPCDLEEAVEEVRAKLAAAGWPEVEVKIHFGRI